MGRKRAGSEDSDYSPRKKVKRTTKPQHPPTKASITILATDLSPDQTGVRDRLDKIDCEALGRIKKALALASHEATGEKEAKAALRMASKLMARYSVTQADILSQETDAEKLQRAGTSVVSVGSTKPGGSVKLEMWASTLSNAMTTFFDCQCYTTTFSGGKEKVEFSFYGLAEQTVAAAYAMEMAYNLILAWSLSKVSTGVHKKNAYRTGVAEGLIVVAKAEKREEKEKAIVHEQRMLEQKRKEEEEEDRRRLDRLKSPEKTVEGAKPKLEPQDDVNLTDHVTPAGDMKVKLEEIEDEDQPSFHRHNSTGTPRFSRGPKERSTSPVPFEDADDDDDDEIPANTFLATADFNDSDADDNMPDLDSAEPRIKPQSLSPFSLSMPPPPLPLIPPKDDPGEEESQWGSVNQLVAFRETSVAVGEEYLKSQGIKLGKGRSQPSLEIKDWEAREMYNQGVKDAKKIDVRGRRLKGPEDD